MSYASDELPTGLTAVTSLGANDLFIIQVDGETIVKGVKQSDVFKNIAQSAITNLVSDLAAKQATITGAATTITSSDLTINRALVSDGSGKVAISTVTSTELGYLSGVSSALQTQIDGKQTLDSDLTSIAGLSPVNDDIIQRKSGSWTNRTIDQFTTDLALVVADITDFPTIVSQAEAEAGVATTARLWTAERVAQAISALETGGGSTTLLGLTDTDITTPATGHLIIYDGTDSWDNKEVSGDITINASGVTAIESGVIVDADINASASIALSKLAAMTINRLVVTDASGFLSASTVTNTEAGYLSGVSSAIQTQIDGKLANIVEDITPQLGGALDGQGNDLNNLGVMFLTEQAAAEADVAGKGQIWVKTVTPNQLWFTDDAGNDKRLDTDTLTIPFEIYEGGSVISASTKILGVRLPFGYTITRATLFADASGSVTVQILTATPGSSPTFTDISNGGISLSSSDYVTDTTLTGWTTAVAADKLIQCKVTGTPATITHLSVSLEAKRT